MGQLTTLESPRPPPFLAGKTAEIVKVQNLKASPSRSREQSVQPRPTQFGPRDGIVVKLELGRDLHPVTGRPLVTHALLIGDALFILLVGTETRI